MKKEVIWETDELLFTRPSEEHLAELAAYRQAFLDAGDSMDGTGPLRRMEASEDYLRTVREYEDPATVPAGRVPATQLILVRKADGRVVGMLQVRHTFNDYLEKYAGHIGYSVHPAERRRGYAKAMLAASLPFCREIGLERVLVSCIDGNVGSERTILACGGVYESTVFEPDGGVYLKRFWITL